jgi:hypothetical protein
MAGRLIVARVIAASVITVFAVRGLSIIARIATAAGSHDGLAFVLGTRAFVIHSTMGLVVAASDACDGIGFGVGVRVGIDSSPV